MICRFSSPYFYLLLHFSLCFAFFFFFLSYHSSFIYTSFFLVLFIFPLLSFVSCLRFYLFRLIPTASPFISSSIYASLFVFFFLLISFAFLFHSLFYLFFVLLFILFIYFLSFFSLSLSSSFLEPEIRKKRITHLVNNFFENDNKGNIILFLSLFQSLASTTLTNKQIPSYYDK